MRGALRPGGRLAAQCGGAGNIDAFRGLSDEVAAREPYASHLDGFEAPWYYAGPEETEERLRAAGFDEVRCWLQPWEVHPARAGRVPAARLILGPYVDRLPEELQRPLRRRRDSPNRASR